MKKFTLLILGIVLIGLSQPIVADSCCKCKHTSHSFFTVRPPYQSGSPERFVGFRDRLTAREDGWAGAIQATVFGGRSTEEDKLALYFTPFCKRQLTVGNRLFDDPTQNPDLMAQNFNILTQLNTLGVAPNPSDPQPFNSTICISPRQTMAGVGFTWRQGFYQRCTNDCWFWFELSVPIEHVENQVRLSETLDPDNTDQYINDTVPHNMIEAFNQESWQYGKINDCCKLEKTGVADIEIKLGYEWAKNDCCFLESYLGILAPTGNAPKAHYLFEPIVGHNKHAGAIIGSTGIFDIWQSCSGDTELKYAVDMYALYLFRHCEKRSFDLKYRPWSRYMAVYANKEQAQEAQDLLAVDNIDDAYALFTPGINVFTRDLKIDPRLASTVNNALFVNHCGWQAEIGYNFYMREAECVCLNCCQEETAAPKSIFYFGTVTENTNIINSYQTINLEIEATEPMSTPQPISKYDQNIITQDQFDLESAAHPAVFTNTFYGSLFYRWDNICYPTFFGLGGLYEWSDENTGLNRWMGWVKGGVSF